MRKIDIRTNNFIERAISKHGEFDYSKVIYFNAKTKVEIVCPKHGSFYQRPDAHLSGQKCMKCKLENHSKKTGYNNISFSNKANEIHDFKYDYSNVNYKHSQNKIEIICKKHGSFQQKPTDHLKGQGCPRCKCKGKVSKAELEIFMIISSSFDFKIITSDRNEIYPYELDIYIPELQKAIEFNGLYWHYDKSKFIPGKHAMKSNMCREKGIQLLHIREDLWLRDKDKVKNFILKFLKK